MQNASAPKGHFSPLVQTNFCGCFKTTGLSSRKHKYLESFNLPFFQNRSFCVSTVTEGRIHKWHKKVGDFVETDELVAQIGTEKTIVEIRAPEAGIITQLLAQEQETIKIGAELYLLDTTISLPIKNERVFSLKPRERTLVQKSKEVKTRKKKEVEEQKEEEEEEEGPTVTLGPEQQKVMDIVLSGQSLFFTGPAGTGKSLLLKEIIKKLRKIHSKKSVFVTASTGIAACNIGGITIHSFAGIGIGTLPKEDYVKIITRNKPTLKKWQSAKVLIIDEVSMLGADLLDILEYVARQVREDDSLFGGIQVVLCGDFLQLPPVEKKEKCRKNILF